MSAHASPIETDAAALALVAQDATQAAEARAVLEAAGCQAIRIEGSGERWHVWCGYGPGEFFVSAFSAKNPQTPNDPVYLARQALATLQRNERRDETGKPLGSPDEAAAIDAALGLKAAQATPEKAAATPSPEGEDVPTNAQARQYAEYAEAVAQSVGEYEAAPDDPVFDAEFLEPEAAAAGAGLDALMIEGADLGDLPSLEYEPEGLAPDEFGSEPEVAEASTYIFGDNLAADRLIRIGQITERAAELIAQAREAVGAQEGELNATRSHVVVHLNGAGAYVGPEPQIYRRFVELSETEGRVASIERHAKERADFVRAADRAAVAAFDPGAGWPVQSGEGGGGR